MATLNFKGKNIIWNHHLSVPYHTLDLDDKLSYNKDKANGNLIIEGDNLPALKSLLPQYTGKIKCIYIDPPYNTGEENWIYNDNVSSPLMNEWFGKIVDKEDLTRHDKWLTMMTPRLKLLRELLKEDGVMFVSIDDNEMHHLRCLLDEIFGEENFVGTITWEKRTKGQNTKSAKDKLQSKTEYILVYKKYTDKLRFKLLVTGKKEYELSDEKGNYREKAVEQMSSIGMRGRETMIFPILGISPDKDKQWKVGKDLIDMYLKRNDVIAKEGKLYLKVRPFDEEEERYAPFWSHFFDKEVYGTAEQGKSELSEILGTELHEFETVKPVSLIKKLFFHIKNIDESSFSKDDIVLDAFAGSGTTAQAVFELNEEDNGNRKFILIQIPESSKQEPTKNVCRDITRERIVKVIEKKLTNKEVGFEYKKVGQQIDAETILSGKLPTFEQLAKYVFYLATGQTPKDKDINEKKYLAGKIDHTEVYLLYKQNLEELQQLALTFDWAKEISEGNSNKKIVYAPACFLDDEYMEKFNMKFVSIPYNLFERQK